MFLLNGFLIIVFVGFVFSFVLNGVVIEGVLDDEKEVNCEKWLNFVVVLLLWNIFNSRLLFIFRWL